MDLRWRQKLAPCIGIDAQKMCYFVRPAQWRIRKQDDQSECQRQHNKDNCWPACNSRHNKRKRALRSVKLLHGAGLRHRDWTSRACPSPNQIPPPKESSRQVQGLSCCTGITALQKDNYRAATSSNMAFERPAAGNLPARPARRNHQTRGCSDSWSDRQKGSGMVCPLSEEKTRRRSAQTEFFATLINSANVTGNACIVSRAIRALS
jgi:hypothetical protein